MSLLDDVRVALRVTHEMTDVEIQGYIDMAFADMSRVGIRQSLLDPESPNPMVRHAVVMFCKGSYGFDNSEGERFLMAYNTTVTALMNSKFNECADDEDTESRLPKDEPDETGGDDTDGDDTGDDTGGDDAGGDTGGGDTP